MNIIYLTWGETPRSYGVFRSQAINQLIKTKNLMPNQNFFFLSGIPVIHSGWIREKFSYVREIKKIKATLKPIKFDWIPIYASQNFVNSNRFTFNFMHGLALIHLYRKLKKINPSIIHCRSYHATWAALSVKKKYSLKYKVIFDARGPWPEEVALKKGYKENSKNFNFLKKIESTLIKDSNLTITVSKTMHDHFINLGAKNDFQIGLGTDLNKFSNEQNSKISENNERDNLRFCYVGALSKHTWHEPLQLAQLFLRIKELFPKAKLTIITTSRMSKIKKIFYKKKITDYSIITTRTIEELVSILSLQDIGLISYSIPRNVSQIRLAKSGFSIKAVEYLASGLPIICNKYLAGISNFIREHDLGIVYDPLDLSTLTKDSIYKCTYSGYRNKILKIAKDFDYSEHAKIYKKIYLS